MTAPDSSTLDALRIWLDDSSTSARIMTGATVTIRHQGAELFHHQTGTDGTGAPISTRDLGIARCSVMKPTLFLACAALVDQNKIDLDAPIGSQLDRPMLPEIAAIPVWAILAHHAGLHINTGLHLMMVPESDQGKTVRMSPLTPGFRVGVDYGYSDTAGPVILAELIEQQTGMVYDEFFRSLLPHPTIRDEVFVRFDDDGFEKNIDRISVNCFIGDSFVLPYLIERSKRVALEWNPGWSAYASSRGLAMLYEWFGDLVSGRIHHPEISHATLERMLKPRRPAPMPNELLGFEEPIGNELSHVSLGMYHGFESHGVPGWAAPDVIGHGGMGLNLALVDTARQLTIAMRFYGHRDHTEHRALRCDRVVESAYAAIDSIG